MRGIAAKMATSRRMTIVRDAMKPKEVVVKLVCKITFYEFYMRVVRRMFGKKAMYPKHLQRMIDAVLGTSGAEMVVAVPRRHSKTQTLLMCLCYKLLTKQRSKCFYGTYSEDLARVASTEIDKILNTWAKICGLPEQRYGNNEQKTLGSNTLYIRSLNGSITGIGYNDTAVIDDPIKNKEAADSAKIRDVVFGNIQSAVLSGNEDSTHTNTICVGTRWSEDDPQGRLIAMGWEYVNFPAINDNNEALWPEMRPIEHLLKIKKTCSGYTWETLFQGNPSSKNNRLFDKNIKRHCDIEADVFRETGRHWREMIQASVVGIDFAYTRASYSDYCARVVAHLLPGGRVVLENEMLERMGADEFLSSHVATLGLQCAWYVSDSERFICSEIQRSRGIVINPLKSFGKLFSAQWAIREWNAGNIYVPDDWEPQQDNSTPIGQILYFNGNESQHDDFVDAMSAAIDTLLGRYGSSDLESDLLGLKIGGWER